MGLYSHVCPCCVAPESQGCVLGAFACRCQQFSLEYAEAQHPSESLARLGAGVVVDTCVECHKCPAHCQCERGYHDAHLTLEAATSGKPYPVYVPHAQLPRDQFADVLRKALERR